MSRGPRSLARERALGLIYEASLKSVAPSVVLAELPAPPDPFATELVEAVEKNLSTIDPLLAAASVDWELSRMPIVDLTVLRLAVAELITWPETPVAVVLDEAVELAKEFSTEESGKFVNGVLSSVVRKVRPDSEIEPRWLDVGENDQDSLPENDRENDGVKDGVDAPENNPVGGPVIDPADATDRA
jgi:transcription antitermination protein NusB